MEEFTFTKKQVGSPCHKYIMAKMDALNHKYVMEFAKSYLSYPGRDNSVPDLIAISEFSKLPHRQAVDFCMPGESKKIPAQELHAYLMQERTDISVYPCERFYKRIDRKMGACRLCPYSDSYSNATYDMEKAVLRLMMESTEDMQQVISAVDGKEEKIFASYYDISEITGSSLCAVAKVFLPLYRMMKELKVCFSETCVKPEIFCSYFSKDDMPHGTQRNDETIQKVFMAVCQDIKASRLLPFSKISGFLSSFSETVAETAHADTGESTDCKQTSFAAAETEKTGDSDTASCQSDKDKQADGAVMLSLFDIELDTPHDPLEDALEDLPEDDDMDLFDELGKAADVLPGEQVFEDEDISLSELSKPQGASKPRRKSVKKKKAGGPIVIDAFGLPPHTQGFPFIPDEDTPCPQADDNDWDAPAKQPEPQNEYGTGDDSGRMDMTDTARKEQTECRPGADKNPVSERPTWKQLVVRPRRLKSIVLSKNESKDSGVPAPVKKNAVVLDETDGIITVDESAFSVRDTSSTDFIPQNRISGKVLCENAWYILPDDIISLQTHFVRDRKMITEAVLTDDGNCFLLFYLYKEDRYYFTDMEDPYIYEKLLPYFTQRGIMLLTGNPYLLYGVCKIWGLEVKNVVGLQGMYCELYGDHNIKNLEQIIEPYKKTVSSVHTGYAVFDDMQYYFFAYRDMIVKLSENKKLDSFSDRLLLEEGLGRNYLKCLYMAEAEHLYELHTDGYIFHNRQAPFASTIPGYILSYVLLSESRYSLKEYTDILFELIRILADKGRFRKCELQIISVYEDCIAFFVSDYYFEYILNKISSLFFAVLSNAGAKGVRVKVDISQPALLGGRTEAPVSLRSDGAVSGNGDNNADTNDEAGEADGETGYEPEDSEDMYGDEDYEPEVETDREYDETDGEYDDGDYDDYDYDGEEGPEENLPDGELPRDEADISSDDSGDGGDDGGDDREDTDDMLSGNETPAERTEPVYNMTPEGEIDFSMPFAEEPEEESEKMTGCGSGEKMDDDKKDSSGQTDDIYGEDLKDTIGSLDWDF